METCFSSIYAYMSLASSGVWVDFFKSGLGTKACKKHSYQCARRKL